MDKLQEFKVQICYGQIIYDGQLLMFGDIVNQPHLSI